MSCRALSPGQCLRPPTLGLPSGKSRLRCISSRLTDRLPTWETSESRGAAMKPCPNMETAPLTGPPRSGCLKVCFYEGVRQAPS